MGHDPPAQTSQRADGEERRDERRAEDPFRVVGGQQQRALRPFRERHQHRSLGIGRVHHGERVARELALRIEPRIPWSIGSPVSAWVERQDATVAREVRDLRLPAARVDDHPGREEQKRRIAVAVALLEHPHAVALDAARGVWTARPGHSISAMRCAARRAPSVSTGR
jgi:hypothetical protein